MQSQWSWGLLGVDQTLVWWPLAPASTSSVLVGRGQHSLNWKAAARVVQEGGLRRPKKSPPLSLISSCWECWFVLLYSVETEAVFVNVALSRKNVSSLRCPLGRAVAECHHLCCERVISRYFSFCKEKNLFWSHKVLTFWNLFPVAFHISYLFKLTLMVLETHLQVNYIHSPFIGYWLYCLAFQGRLNSTIP